MLKQDYLLRQVESLAMSLSKLFFNKDMVQYKLEEKDNLSDTDILSGEEVGTLFTAKK